MSLEHWNKRPDGTVEIGPLLGHEVVKVDIQGAVRLSFAYSEEHRKEGGASVQLMVTAEQAQSLAAALSALAERLGAMQAASTVQ